MRDIAVRGGGYVTRRKIGGYCRRHRLRGDLVVVRQETTGTRQNSREDGKEKRRKEGKKERWKKRKRDGNKEERKVARVYRTHEERDDRARERHTRSA